MLTPSWEFIHHLADLAAIGLFLLTIYTVYLSAPPSSADTTVRPAGAALSIRRLRRPAKITLAAILGASTIALFIWAGQPIAGPVGPRGPQGSAGVQGPPGPPDVHVATAYWYRIELDKLNKLIVRWDSVTKNVLNHFLENHGVMPYSSDTDLNTIEANIKDMVQKDFTIDLDFARHPKFDANPFYDAPKVDQITKDADKEEYRRLYDQYSVTRYTLDQVTNAYEAQISTQEDFIIQHIQRPSHCYYTKNGNFGCG